MYCTNTHTDTHLHTFFCVGSVSLFPSLSMRRGSIFIHSILFATHSQFVFMKSHFHNMQLVFHIRTLYNAIHSIYQQYTNNNTHVHIRIYAYISCVALILMCECLCATFLRSLTLCIRYFSGIFFRSSFVEFYYCIFTLSLSFVSMIMKRI